MKPGGGRNKGANGEREIVALARELGFAGAKRTAPMQAGYGDEFPDVDGLGVLWVEAKCYRRTPVNRFAREHVDQERPGYVPVLAWRDNRTQWRATLTLADLLKLVRLAYPRADAATLPFGLNVGGGPPIAADAVGGE